MYVKLEERTSEDINASADINQLSENCEVFNTECIKRDGSVEMTGRLQTGNGLNGGIGFEGDKHVITNNDGGGNFNIRVGNRYDVGCTEDGYTGHLVFNQSNGYWEFKTSSASLTVGANPTWKTVLQLKPTDALNQCYGRSRSAVAAWDYAINLYNVMYPSLYNANHRTEATAKACSGAFHISGVIVVYVSHAFARADGWLEIWGLYNTNGYIYCIYIRPNNGGYTLGHGGQSTNISWYSDSTKSCMWSIGW